MESDKTRQLLAHLGPSYSLHRQVCGWGFGFGYKQFPGKPAAEVSYKNKLTYGSVSVLSIMRFMMSGV